MHTGLAIALSVYAVSTVAIACILLWRYKREPQRRVMFAAMLAIWLAVPLVIWFVPSQWLEWMDSKPGHPSWFSVAILVLLVAATAQAIWSRPERRRFYAAVWVPLLTWQLLVQIIYPLFWQR